MLSSMTGHPPTLAMLQWEDDGGMIPDLSRARSELTAILLAATREDWLTRALNLLRPMFKQVSYTVPDRVRVSVGFPKGSGRRGSERVGECWDSVVSADGTFEVFISPTMDNPRAVLAILVHEIAHAVAGHKAGHRKPFQQVMAAMHMVAPWTTSTPGPGFDAAIYSPIVAAIPFAFPHARMSIRGELLSPRAPRIDPETGEPIPEDGEDKPGRIGKQTTRAFKCQCPDCGYTVRVSRKWLAVGLPVCPTDSIPMSEAK